MYKVLIVDDETIVRQGIRQLIEWEKHGFEICAEGIDGKDGLKKIGEYQPDLVLVDIKMPGLSGIELVKEARKQGYKGVFLILTGYSDFYFAKSAINLGVKGYLLKPIDEDEVHGMLDEIKQELDQERFHESYVSVSVKKAKQEVLRRVLSHRLEMALLQKDVALYHIDFSSNCYCVCIAKFNSHMLEDECILEKSVIDDKLDTLLVGINNVETITEEDKAILILKGHTYEKACEMLCANNQRIKNREGEAFFLTFGHTVVSWKDLVYSYECAKLLLDYEFLYDSEGALTIKVFENVEQGYLENFVERLCNMIEVGNKDGIHQALQNYENHIKTSLIQESEVKVLTAQNLILLHNNLCKRYEKIKDHFPSLSQITSRIMEATSIEQLKEHVTKFAYQLCDCIGNTSSDNVVKRMYAYMDKNYDKELKLENIAKMFNYNSAYLGKVFKKEFGESFNVTLDKIRIENAKKFLLSGSMKVYQVSEKVGFSNIDYFCSKFKKYVGVSPKEFKKEKVN
ncbi:MAG: response regulator transcription factor [bacterium]|nr:response regulator transcription factor [bacterium]